MGVGDAAALPEAVSTYFDELSIDLNIETVKIDISPLSNNALAPNGFHYQNYISSISSIQKVNKLGVILTCQPISGGESKFVLFKNWVLISLNKSELSNTGYVSVLVYSSVIWRQLDGRREVSEHDSDCVFSIPLYSNKKIDNICSSCQKDELSSFPSWRLDMEKLKTGKKLLNNNSLILVHGIKSRGGWFDRFSKHLEKEEIDITALYFAKVSVKNLYQNEKTGNLLVEKIEKEYSKLRRRRKDCEISIIAHSYGSLIVAEALKRHSHLKINSLILLGSIVPREFDFHTLMPSQIKKILNECGDRDWLPAAAEYWIPGAGSSGTYFFEQTNSLIYNRRIKKCGHSGMLTRERLIHEWLPFIYAVFPTVEVIEIKISWVVSLMEKANKMVKYCLEFFLRYGH